MKAGKSMKKRISALGLTVVLLAGTVFAAEKAVGAAQAAEVKATAGVASEAIAASAEAGEKTDAAKGAATAQAPLPDPDTALRQRYFAIQMLMDMKWPGLRAQTGLPYPGRILSQSWEERAQMNGGEGPWLMVTTYFEDAAAETDGLPHATKWGDFRSYRLDAYAPFRKLETATVSIGGAAYRVERIRTEAGAFVRLRDLQAAGYDVWSEGGVPALRYDEKAAPQPVTEAAAQPKTLPLVSDETLRRARLSTLVDVGFYPDSCWPLAITAQPGADRDGRTVVRVTVDYRWLTPPRHDFSLTKTYYADALSGEKPTIPALAAAKVEAGSLLVKTGTQGQTFAAEQIVYNGFTYVAAESLRRAGVPLAE